MAEPWELDTFGMGDEDETEDLFAPLASPMGVETPMVSAAPALATPEVALGAAPLLGSGSIRSNVVDYLQTQKTSGQSRLAAANERLKLGGATGKDAMTDGIIAVLPFILGAALAGRKGADAGAKASNDVLTLQRAQAQIPDAEKQAAIAEQKAAIAEIANTDKSIAQQLDQDADSRDKRQFNQAYFGQQMDMLRSRLAGSAGKAASKEYSEEEKGVLAKIDAAKSKEEIDALRPLVAASPALSRNPILVDLFKRNLGVEAAQNKQGIVQNAASTEVVEPVLDPSGKPKPVLEWQSKQGAKIGGELAVTDGLIGDYTNIVQKDGFSLTGPSAQRLRTISAALTGPARAFANTGASLTAGEKQILQALVTESPDNPGMVLLDAMRGFSVEQGSRDLQSLFRKMADDKLGAYNLKLRPQYSSRDADTLPSKPGGYAIGESIPIGGKSMKIIGVRRVGG